MGSRVQIFNLNGSGWTQKGNTILSCLGWGDSVSLSANGKIVCIDANNQVVITGPTQVWCKYINFIVPTGNRRDSML